MRDREAEQAEHPTKVPSRASRRGLDWFTFFVADIQTGFGPFLSVYLTTQKWTQVDIGLVLSIGSIASLLGQVPGGWVVDWARSKQRVAALAVIGIGVSAFLIAVAPVFATIVAAKLAARRCQLGSGPGHRRHYARAGGPCSRGPAVGSQRALCRRSATALQPASWAPAATSCRRRPSFFVTAVLAIPALLALRRIREADVDPIRADGGIDTCDASHRATSLGRLLRNARACSS